MKSFFLRLAVLLILIVLTYCGFKFDRWWHYKVGYESKVQAEVQKQIQPLEAEIRQLQFQTTDLQRQILTLQTNH